MKSKYPKSLKYLVPSPFPRHWMSYQWIWTKFYVVEVLQRQKIRDNLFLGLTIYIPPPGKSVIFLFPPKNCSSPTILKSPFLLQGEFLRKKCSPPRAVGGMPLCIILRKWGYKRQKNKKSWGLQRSTPKKVANYKLQKWETFGPLDNKEVPIPYLQHFCVRPSVSLLQPFNYPTWS